MSVSAASPKTTSSPKTAPLYGMIKALDVLQDYTENREITALAIQILLHVATRDEIPMAELSKLCGCTHAAVSRTLAKLAQGLNPDVPGAKLLDYYEDPYFRARKLVRLSPKGKDMAKALLKVLGA